MIDVRFCITGAPRTKKNHSRVVRAGAFTKVLPSEAYEAWEKAVVPVLRNWAAYHMAAPINHDVNCEAIIYRDAHRGDAVGYYQGIADLLQTAGIVRDDKLIVSWDGSRLRKDPERPRVEITLSRVGANGGPAGKEADGVTPSANRQEQRGSGAGEPRAPQKGSNVA